VAEVDVQGIGTREQPWQLKTPSGTSEYQAEVEHNPKNNRIRAI
jgi:hypothetical protein